MGSPLPTPSPPPPASAAEPPGPRRLVLRDHPVQLWAAGPAGLVVDGQRRPPDASPRLLPRAAVQAGAEGLGHCSLCRAAAVRVTAARPLQLAGQAVLASSVDAAPAGFDAHVWCPDPSWGPGAVLLSYCNMAAEPVNVSFFGQQSGAQGGVGEYTAYFVTSAPSAEAAPYRSDHGDPPPSVFGDAAFLNGAPLAVNADGTLPVWPLPGTTVPAGQAFVEVPPWSYGFAVMHGIPGLTPPTGCPGAR